MSESIPSFNWEDGPPPDIKLSIEYIDKLYQENKKNTFLLDLHKDYLFKFKLSAKDLNVYIFFRNSMVANGYLRKYKELTILKDNSKYKELTILKDISEYTEDKDEDIVDNNEESGDNNEESGDNNEDNNETHNKDNNEYNSEIPNKDNNEESGDNNEDYEHNNEDNNE